MANYSDIEAAFDFSKWFIPTQQISSRFSELANRDKGRVQDALVKLFEDSPGTELIQSLLNANKKVSFEWNSTSVGPRTNNDVILVNAGVAGKIGFVNTQGNFIPFSLERLLYHELIHASSFLLTGTATDDGLFGDIMTTQTTWDKLLGNPSIDEMKGPTVILTNEFSEQFPGEKLANNGHIRPSYLSAGSDGLLNLASASWLLGEVPSVRTVLVDALRLGSVIDVSKLGISADLVIGLDRVDELIGGAGNDFLYGGLGNDILRPGSGDDIVHGGDLVISYTSGTADQNKFKSDGIDTADFSVGDNGGANGGAIEVLIGEGANANEGDITVQDGMVGTDRLISIERIIGTDQDDKITLTGFLPEQLGTLEHLLLEYIDLGGEGADGDIIDASGYSQGANSLVSGDRRGVICFT